jgi:predicted acetyltransferase
MWQRAGMSQFDIRPVAVEERRAVMDAVRAALLSGAVNDEAFEQGAASWDGSDGLAAWEGDRCIGHAGAFRFDSTIPGGAIVATAGVTRVGVIPTHTRRGVLTQLMHRLLVESRERGQVLATLHASETPIYHRFGFGLATDSAAVEITTRSSAPWRARALPGSMRLLEYREVYDVVPSLYEQVARWRVGSISRPAWWWKWTLEEAARPLKEARGKGTFVAVHTSASGTDDGYVLYDVGWADGFAENPTGKGNIHDLWGASPDVELALWRYVLDIDLVTTWGAEPRPVDEPVRRAMHDTRAYRCVNRFDDQWVRILDLDSALEQRSYGEGRDVIVHVHDPLFERGSGTWLLSPHGARRTDSMPEVEVRIETMSAAYLGAVSWHDLAASGQVTAPPQVLDRLDALFAVRPAPFCGTGY